MLVFLAGLTYRSTSNVLGLLYATNAAIEAMKEQGSGHLVNVSSVAGRKVTRDSSGVYAGTKFGVNAISEGLRQELLNDNIRGWSPHNLTTVLENLAVVGI